MGMIINFNSIPKVVKLGGRQKRIARRTEEINQQFEDLKKRSKALIEKHKKNFN